MTPTERLVDVARPSQLTPGGIYRLQDSLIRFPDTDAKKTRTLHDYRTVLVMSSAAVCASKAYGCVIIAPMSHLVNFCAGTDVIIQPNRENRLDAPGRVLLSYMQPMIKSDVELKIGVMSDEDWQTIMVAVIAGLDH
jgi:hypothetical protein